MSRTKFSILAISIATVLMSVLPSHAATDHPFFSGGGEQFRGYTTPAIVIQPGDTVTYYNFDVAQHDVVAGDVNGDLYGPDTPACAQAQITTGKCPLFWTPLIGLAVGIDGKLHTTPVYGIEAVKSGTYPFKCTIHAAMAGTLVVLPS